MWLSRIIAIVLISIVIVSATKKRRKNPIKALQPDFSVVANPSHNKNTARKTFIEDDGTENDDADYIDNSDNFKYYGARKKGAAAKPKTKREDRRVASPTTATDHSDENEQINEPELDEQASPHASPIVKPERKEKRKGKAKAKGKNKKKLVGLERQDRSIDFGIGSKYKNKGDQILHFIQLKYFS